ncbi:helix-turn-helix domain-containing protein [Flavobacterium amniphilum]|uniref:helix-turn-helix domain-containing protein n=1 Tax=Flavobacterium amniphilum TaxID=1834035 RepID=UPI00202A32D4|nr:helix-turn-helix domain-containing protein [Flavobacterium amniphilum]MCL9804138.1 helix-turn-helix domain-containing protein [Flavobacterium amniphilum]
MQTISSEAKYTLQFINQTKRNIFLTGKAGTGKTTLLRDILKTTHKNVVVVAPTGIAALNAGGVTIHSLFQLPFAAFLPDYSEPKFTEFSKFESRSTLARHFKMNSLKKSVLRNLELLIIDEVSMLRADLLDAMDFMLQHVRKNKEAFGGVQVLFIGDLLQLPPVIKEDEWQVLRQFYKGKYFFHSHVIQQKPPLYIELSKIFRQTDDTFISILNNLRNNQVTLTDISTLNQYVNAKFDSKINLGFITITTHNYKADSLNTKSLSDLQGQQKSYYPEVIGDFPEKIFPVDSELNLKVGAQIMFIKNDLSVEKRFFNGKMGVIESLSDEEIMVRFDDNSTILVEKYEWQNIKYSLNIDTKEIEEEVLGTFVHYPIKLAWAITVHKSQGMTFDKAALDVSQVFLPGQAYVALSRLRSLNGLILLSPLQMNGISSDSDVMDYSVHKADESLLATSLQTETQTFLAGYLKSAFDWQNLTQEWRNYQFSHDDKSGKNQHFIWAKKHTELLVDLAEASRKFRSQLDQLFSRETIDYEFIEVRIIAAYDYFFPKLDAFVFEVLWKLEEVKRLKKHKAIYEELLVLEEFQIKSVLDLMKAVLLIRNIASGEIISKENLTSDKIKSYKINKLELVRNEFKKLNHSLIDDSVDENRYSKKSKKEKEAKKSTTEITFELWKENNSLKDIAVIRKFSMQTIIGHMVKLIEAGKVSILELLPDDKIKELEKAFEDYQEDTLNPLKEKYGDQFTWDELKMYRANILSGK